jgi:outer membrane protein OmpA-like peptidoglycan-associated protein
MTRHFGMLTRLGASILVIGATSAGVTAQTGTAKQIELGTFGTYTLFDGTSLRYREEFGAGGLLGVFFTNTFSLEASGDFTETTLNAGSNTRVTATRLSGTLFAQRRVLGGNAIYLGAGYERVFYRAADTFDDNGIHVRLGDRLPLGGRAVLRLEGRAAYYPSSPHKAAGDQVFNLSATAGISIFAFGGPPRDSDGDGVGDGGDACPGTPIGAIVDGAGCPQDEDKDGIFNGLDQCPGTPAGADVDTIGCPADADGDGAFNGVDTCPNTPRGAVVDGAGCPSDGDLDAVFDGLDQCADTPAGATVDDVGCPSDEDRDGVFDGIDRCQGTPTGTGVDATGCPADDDGDGVGNSIDRCPNTPRNATVDATGCPPAGDSDRDGVNDNLDRCPNTAPGQQVDAIGCPVLFVVDRGVRQPLVLRGVNFATGSSRLTPESYAILDQVASSLIAHPEVAIEIGGHTDNTGSLRTNTRLSLARAESVRAYLAQKGVPVERMEARGFGPDRPVATNATAEGRAENRRVELRQTNQ